MSICFMSNLYILLLSCLVMNWLNYVFIFLLISVFLQMKLILSLQVNSNISSHF